MYFGKILKADTANGSGIRVTVFVSGCTNHCKGCFQPETWAFDYGSEFTPDVEQMVISELSKPFYKGLTILGGEPFEPTNQAGILPLIKRVRTELPDKDIWVYTGFLYDSDLIPGGKRYTANTDELLDNIDVLVDGRFVEGLKNISLRFRGSENQRIIDMKASRREGTVVLSDLNTARNSRQAVM